MTLPREAFKHPFLLQGIFAASSLETAATDGGPLFTHYVNLALEYNGKALGSFRNALPNMTTNGQFAFLTFSVITMVLSLALPHLTKTRERPESMVQGMVTHFRLLQGAGMIRMQDEVLAYSSLGAGITTLAAIPRRPLNSNDTEAFDRLSAVNDEKHNTNSDQTLVSKLEIITLHSACQKAILLLEDLWAKCLQHSDYYGHPLTWLNVAGEDFVTAIDNGDTVALLALMYWALLAKQCGQGVWWAQSIGETLVGEITAKLEGEKSLNVRACLTWAQDEVNSTNSE